MSHTLYWIWLQQKLGAGAGTQAFFEHFADVRQVYEACSYPRFIKQSKLALLADKDLSAAREIAEYCAKKGYTIVTPDDAAYPDAFRHLPDFPCVLYIEGKIDLNAEPMISIVGARKATYYGLNVATRLAYSLAAGGMCIVSGGALGTDCAAHKGALYAGGKTVMVLGCGLDGGYLKENEAMRKSVLSRGAVISEFPPKMAANRFSFPIRNRLIAALGRGTVVVQASVKSGSLITARFAKQYGRDVYGVPGGIYNQDFQGVNELIRDGASIVIGVEDIIGNYVADYPDKLDEQKAMAFDIKDNEELYRELPKTHIEAVDEEIEFQMQRKNRFPGLSPATRLVYDSLETGPKHINEISALTSLSLSQVLSHLTALELMDAVVALEGRKYKQS